ncbi:hypothetical protein AbraIFM66951_008437 [Aspergillus brasiliensis]|uniref:Uncharacterized protein n=1 Tax=Aspergillus brasiliensis TaxID=319629 RepID=A0A9W5YMJ6_9EURO|nr:hypothetical protein AbraCBS73388_005402 [Aspergillus brasiliensis]GKZ45753.1 hypothetical protein AbraIFM66951_008437 [Aspergillus brasiliensis]
MYGSQSGHQRSGPPQPEWRLPSSNAQQPAATSSRHPPQPSWRASSPPPPPPPPRPTSSFPYNPTVYGQISNPPSTVHSYSGTSISPVSAVAGADTTSWGVKYNRHQLHAQSAPPLPPRPSSTAQSPQAQSPVVSPQDPNKPLPAAPDSSYQQWPSNPPYAPQQAVSASPLQPPPPPPAISTDHQSSSAHQSNPWQQPPPVPPPPYSGVSLGQYQDLSVQQPATLPSNAQPTGYNAPNPAICQAPSPKPGTPLPYESQPLPGPPPAPVTATLSTAHGAPPVVPPPVPPKTSPITAPTSATVLASGGPSDWEHLSPTPGSIDDLGAFGFRPQDGSSSKPQSQVSQSRPTNIEEPVRKAESVSPTTPSTNASQMMNQTEGPLAGQTVVRGDPPQPVRMDATGSVHSDICTSEVPESIDGIIEAWNRPISSQSPAEQNPQSSTSGVRTGILPPSRKQSPIRTPTPRQDSMIPRKQVPSGSSSVESSSVTNGPTTDKRTILPAFVPLDPYDDLDPWSKSSLERYVAMLRKEAVADSDTERFHIFTAFMAKETKLREILFNIEPESTPVGENLKESPRQPTPALRASAKESHVGAESGLIPVETEGDHVVSTSDNGDSEDGSYSPGGRPILPKIQTPSATKLQRSASLAASNNYNADYTAHAPSSRATSVPPSMLGDARHEQALPPLTTNPPQPIYTPFRYTEGPQRGSDVLVFDRPAYQAYSALRQASAESGRVMSNAPAPPPDERPDSAVPSRQNELDETFIGLIREKSVAYRKRAPRKTSSPPPLPVSLRHGKPAGPLDNLRSMASSPLSKQSESSWNMTTRKDLETYSGDFSYIREAVNSWEASSKSRREQLDKERIQRQEVSEKRIDALFNGKEIGYADINVLEEEFRQKEARAQLEEERQELDKFVADVFEPLDQRLKAEIAALQALYEAALAQLDHENGRTKSAGTDRYNLSHTMRTVNEIYRKLELRYQKRLEIALDRERRRKKAERRPLVFMGDSVALKGVDQDFDRMEKRNIFEAARERDDRANRLMDSFDDAIMHGLGENQSLLDDVAAKVAKVDTAAIRSSGLPESEVEQLLKSAYNLIESLRRDSESILHNFNMADSILNDADYSVSVAEARYSDADADVFRRLDDEKRKEDEKIQADLKSKLESIRSGPAEIITSINGLLESIGKPPIVDQPGPLPQMPADTLAPVSQHPTADVAPRRPEEGSEHQERLRKALENAKKRNAARMNTEMSRP